MLNSYVKEKQNKKQHFFSQGYPDKYFAYRTMKSMTPQPLYNSTAGIHNNNRPC